MTSVSILVVTTAIEKKIQEILKKENNAQVYLNGQNNASYPCYIIRIKEAKILPTLPSSYEISFQVVLLGHNEFDLTNLLERALNSLSQEKLQLGTETKNIETLGSHNIPTTLEVFNLECNSVNWAQGQDLISSNVIINYTCSVIHKITAAELLEVDFSQTLLT
jgi:hypothetical protein